MAVLTLICPTAVMITKKPCCNSMVFVAWDAFFWMSFFGFFIGTICLVIGIVLTQGCDVLYNAVNTQHYIENIVGWVPSAASSMQYVDTCLFGDGDLIETLGVTTIFNYLQGIQSSMGASASLWRTAGNPNSEKIPLFSAALANTYDGKYHLVSSTTNTDGTTYNLNQLNLLSDHSRSGSTQSGTAGCTKTKDQWVMNTESCTYTPIWASGDGDSASFGSNICIEINSALVSSNRYTSGTMDTCGQVEGQDIETRLHNWREKLRTQFTDGRSTGATGIGSVKADVDGTIKTNNDDFVEKIYLLTDPIRSLNGTIGEILQSVSDPNTGLYYNLNCAFFRYGLRSLQSTMCNGMVNTFLQITLAVMLMSTFGCVGSVFQFTFAKYMRTKLENDKEGPKKNQVKDESVYDNINIQNSPPVVDYNYNEKMPFENIMQANKFD